MNIKLMSIRKGIITIFAIIVSLILSAYILEINARPFVKKHVIFKMQTSDDKGLAFLVGSIHGGNVDTSIVIPQLEELEQKIGALAIEDYSDTPILHIITATKENGAFAQMSQDESKILEDFFAVFRKKYQSR